jgi:hypothetical protein
VKRHWMVFQTRLFLAVGITILLLLFGFNLWGAKTFGASISVTALADISVYDEPNPSLANTPILILQKGQKREVIGCLDIKTNIVQIIQLDDGRVGYIVNGEAKIVRESYSYFRLPRFSLINCEPFLQN